MSRSAPWVLGIDIGGTSVSVGIVPRDGGPPAALRERATKTMDGASGAVEAIRGMYDEVLREADVAPADVAGAGVGSPGPLDTAAGIVLDAFNLGWKDVPIRDMLADALDLPATLDNDANCATWGEFWQGAGRPYRSVVVVTLGTGIGGGVILDGRLVEGASGSAGELGHMTIDFTGRRCKCGNYGCLEAYASGPNIAARAREGIEAGAESALEDLAGGDLDGITASMVSEAILTGDAYAHEVMFETAKILGAGLANLVNVLNPEAIIVVGGVTRAGDHLFTPLRSEVRRRAFRSAERVCRILPGELPQTAGVIGAAGRFLERTG